ncbi:MAG: Eco57I restriction-modification methylase domain-containing protein, partial [Calditrichaceae bacterium]|nr:Eco57I restriction-modification methylase domain-containing protein [Calditrichaceae bacterium]
QCIYGVDKDPMVVELARLSLWLSVRGNYNTFTKIEKHLKTGDALTGPVDNHDTGGFNWSAEFPEVFRKDKVFDIIIGNPPYGNILKKDEKELATRHYSLIQNGTNKNIVLPFIQRSWALLKDGGCLTFIIPKAMIYVENWKRLRHFLINETDLFSITDNGQSFGSVLLEMVTFLTYKRKPDPKSKILTTRLYAGKYARYSYTDKYKLEKKYFTDQSFLISIDRNEIKRLYHFINRKSLPLEQITTIYRGLSVNNRLKIEYFDTSAPILRGRHLQPFKITGNSYVDKKYLNGFVPGNLLFQEIVAHIYTPAPHIRLIGCLNENSLPSVNTVTNIQLKTNSRFTPEFILGILQSEIINWYIYKFIYMNAFRTMHFSGSYARQVPVPDMPVKDIMSITEIVRQIHNHSLSAETGKNKIDRIVLDYYANDDLSAENINRLINEY